MAVNTGTLAKKADTVILDESYKFLKAAGYASTHADFSINYLGHSARYYDYLRCSGATPSLQALLKLAMRLTDLAHEAADELADTEAGRLARSVMAQALMRCR